MIRFEIKYGWGEGWRKVGMSILNEPQAIMEIDLQKIRTAFVYHAVYLNLAKFSTKFQMDSHGDIYMHTDLYFKNEDVQVIANMMKSQMKDVPDQVYLTIHQSHSTAINIEEVYKGMDEHALHFLKRFSTMEDYRYSYTFYDYPITAGAYFKDGKMYTAQSYDEFMNNGGMQIAILFETARSDTFPESLHEYHRGLFQENWKREVYNEIIQSMETKEFDIYKSCLHEHITKKEFKYLKSFFFDYLDIKVLNARKRDLFKE